jgi:Ca-activated chloride channel homolog
LRFLHGSPRFLASFLAICLLAAVGVRAQSPLPPPSAPPPPPGQQSADQQGHTIHANVNLVVLHTSVIDERGSFVEGLKEENFRILEDKLQQKLSVFKREDIPVTMGLVIDNSGSMRDKRSRVNEAAITLVQASNPSDEAFVVNFNDDFYLDLDKNFTSSITDLKEALERIDSRGSTALYDAIIGSLDHAKKGSRDKKVLLVVTDGEDNASRNSLEKTIREIQQTEVVIYTIGLIGEDEGKKTRNRARKALREIAEASGGLAFFPENVSDVHDICVQVAHDIRNQYTLGYYPSNSKRDGTFRAIQVDVLSPHAGHGKLTARTRKGYYAPAVAGSASAGGN